jgi:hypothetical protein
MLFDPMDRLRSRRLANIVDFRTAGKALVLDDIAEYSKRFNVHKGILS